MAPQSPVIKPSVIKPLVTKPSATKPLVTKSPVIKSPVTKSPVTKSPVTKSPVTKPPVIKPLVTIAIPCFNAENTIERAIKSAQNQDWLNTEILVVDDGSDDGSGVIIEALAKKDKRIRLIGHEINQGLSAARNTAIENARGEFITFFDADDVSYPERVRLQYQRLTNYEQKKRVNLILCYAGVRVIPPKGKPFEKKGIGHRPPEPLGRIFFDYFFSTKPSETFVRGFVGGCVYFARKTTFEKIGPFDPALRRAEDTDHDVRAGLKGAHFISPDAVLMDYYETTASHKTRKEDMKYLVAFAKKYRYMFQKGYVHYFTIKRLVAFTGLAQAKEKNGNLLVLWYRGWDYFWLLILVPRTLLRPFNPIREAFNKVRNVVRPFTRIREAFNKVRNVVRPFTRIREAFNKTRNIERPFTRIREAFNKTRNIVRPFTRIRRARYKLDIFFSSRRTHRAILTSRKVGK